MVGWHHRLNGHEFEQAQGVGDGQGGLTCGGSWSQKELDMTEQLSRTELKEFKVMIIKMLKELRRIDEHNKKFNKQPYHMKSKVDCKNTITKIKTCIFLYVKQIASPDLIHETGRSVSVHWDDHEG